ncbi:MAG: DinB family protein [Proteobacteria bacterium]|nr:DinB family protein [Pseudomonadota bacterium]MBU4468972.1 DinB family protein [Pseudomonadota bacterium]MCG2752098.1 DinB family protein [Desulfobacteraceae bacterium]
MELQRYIGIELSGLKMAMGRALDSLTQQEVIWRPASGCNSIGIILLHVARSEDSFIQGMLQSKPQIWKSEKWYEKLNLAEEEDGAHFTMDQVNAFQVPQLSDIMAYYDAVRVITKERLRAMALEDFDKKVTFPHFGEAPTASIFSLLIAHTSQHIGEISYLRGMQRGMDK